MSSILAFLPAAIAAAISTPTKEAEPPVLPIFKPRWWYRGDRLDARPVAWSLRNRPQDWRWATEGITIFHIPSKHEFWVGAGSYRLWDANCSCTLRSQRGRFQRFQRGTFGRAFRHWKRVQLQIEAVDQKQFAAHFVR